MVDLATQGSYLTHFHWPIAIVVMIVAGMGAVLHTLINKRRGDDE